MARTADDGNMDGGPDDESASINENGVETQEQDAYFLPFSYLSLRAGRP